MQGVSNRNHILAKSDSLIKVAIADRAFPGAAIAVGRGDVLVKLDGYGYFTYHSERQVSVNSKFDLASLTKVVATTTAAMQLSRQVQKNSPSVLMPDYQS